MEGKVAFITGAARGQGRSHAVRLAQEGADIIAVDICSQVESVLYPMSTPEDLQQTVKEVEALGRRIVATQTDVRDYDALEAALDDGVAQLGRLDIVSANAGISVYGRSEGATALSGQTWRDVIDINLTGVWQTAKVSIPHIIAGGRGGSIILTSSMMGLKGIPNNGAYASAKHGLVGLMRVLALELGPHMIRVNTIHPGSVSTPMVHNKNLYALFAPDLENPTREEVAERAQAMNPLPVPWVESEDISNAVLYLASDDGRYITGVTLPIDAGALIN